MALSDNFKTLSMGFLGPQAELLQLALTRAGYPVATDGVFGRETFLHSELFKAITT